MKPTKIDRLLFNLIGRVPKGMSVKQFYTGKEADTTGLLIAIAIRNANLK